ncbi:MAG TPA: glycosyltransferase family 2 protein [Nitrospira sp.]|nr:glycosyltransferase family 2 protein [Nitrospira sp.]
MLNGMRVIVVMPAYNARKTLQATYDELPHDIVDTVLLTDDASTDATATLAKELGIRTLVHPRNRGYGGNQKTCYREALAAGADIVVMVHPDYQYSPKLVTAMAGMIASGHYDLVLASRILGGRAMTGGMPVYKYMANRLLTLIQNVFWQAKLSEYHTGFRAYSRTLLESIPFEANSDDFVFDNQIIAQAIYFRFPVGEITCPTRYFPEASSINLRRSIRYGLGVLHTTAALCLQRMGLLHFAMFSTTRTH